MRLALFLVCLVPLLPVSAQGRKKGAMPDGPKVLYPIPLAVHPGFKGEVILRGLKLDAVAEVTVADPKVTVKAGKPKKVAGPKDLPVSKVGDEEIELELELPADSPPGHLELTAAEPTGKSATFKLTVGPTPAVAEKEPNDSFAKAQPLPLPAAVHGRIERDKDVDVYRFDGTAGRKVRVRVEAARLGSPVDALVVVYDADRRILDSCDDAGGSPDPDLTVTLPRDGVYFVSVIDAHDLGGTVCPYRLLLSPAK